MVRDCEHHFFINRKAGQERALEIAIRMTNLYKDLGITNFYLHYSNDSIDQIDGELRSLIYSPGQKVVYSFGGDGTLTNIVNVLAPYMIKDRNIKEKISLCVVPGGTGNDFYRMLGTDISKKPIDLIKVNNGARYAIGVVSVGIDVTAASFANLMKKEWALQDEENRSQNMKPKKHGDPYTLGIIRTIEDGTYFSAQTINYVDGNNNRHFLEPNNVMTSEEPIVIEVQKPELYVPSRHVKPIFKTPLIAVCNGAYYGNGKPIGKGAKIDDGLLDMIYPDDVNRLKLLGILIKLLMGFHRNSSSVHSCLIKEVRITNPHTPMAVNHDGEVTVYSDEVVISVVEKGIIVDNNFSELGTSIEKEIQKIFKKNK